MKTNLNRVIGVAGALAIVSAGYMAFHAAVKDGEIYAHIAPPARELTEACPGLKGATNFSLVTENFRDFDRFTAIGVKGSICTFKDFSPLPPGAG